MVNISDNRNVLCSLLYDKKTMFTIYKEYPMSDGYIIPPSVSIGLYEKKDIKSYFDESISLGYCDIIKGYCKYNSLNIYETW